MTLVDFRSPSNVVCNVLCVQMPILMNLEQRVLALWRKRAEELISRRRQDVLDQANENAPCKLHLP